MYRTEDIGESDHSVLIVKLKNDVYNFPEFLKPVVIGDKDLTDKLDKCIYYYNNPKNNEEQDGE